MSGRRPELEYLLSRPITSDEADAWSSLGERIMSPGYARADEARAAAADGWRKRRGERPGVQAAVETVCTRLDAEWILDGSRMFLPFVGFRHGQHELAPRSAEDDRPAGLSAWPLNVETAVALAAAGEASVRAAEETALEAARRLSAWRMPSPKGVAWTLVDPGWPRGSPIFNAWYYPASAAEDVARQALYLRGQSSRSHRSHTIGEAMARGVGGGGPRVWSVSAMHYYADAYDAWRVLSAYGVRIEPEPGWSRSAPWSRSKAYPYPVTERGEEASFSRLPDALDPYLVAWSSGFALIDARYDWVVMGAPATFKPVAARTIGLLRSQQEEEFGVGISRREAWPERLHRGAGSS